MLPTSNNKQGWKSKTIVTNVLYLWGALKQGLWTCSTFKSFQLTYHAGTMFIDMYGHSSGLFGLYMIKSVFLTSNKCSYYT